MQRVAWLGRLEEVAIRRALRLRSLVDTYSVPVPSDQDRIVSYVTIEALNLWASFARAYYVSSVLGARISAGGKVTVQKRGIRTPGDAITFSVQRLGPRRRAAGPWKRRDEPAWHTPSTLLTLFEDLGASNLKEVQRAFGYQTRVFGQLPTFRNFFAHRNEESAEKTAQIARAYGLSPRLRPSEVLCSRTVGRPQNILADWLDDLRNVMQLMCS
jgi:hypothetical protein